MPSTRHIVLLGLMASGKSTVGPLLADRLGRPFLDNDVLLAAQIGRSAREIADAEGADELHRLEANVLVEALGRPDPAVIAAAAAAPLEPVAAAPLAANVCVYLCAPPDVLVARLERAPDDGHRPFVRAAAGALLRAQYSARDPRYRALATLTVDACDPAASVVDEITAALSR